MQRTLNNLLRKHLGSGLWLYIDDVAIGTETLDRGVHHPIDLSSGRPGGSASHVQAVKVRHRLLLMTSAGPHRERRRILGGRRLPRQGSVAAIPENLKPLSSLAVIHEATLQVWSIRPRRRYGRRKHARNGGT